MATFEVIHSRPEWLDVFARTHSYARETETFGTYKEAEARYHELVTNHPAPYNRIDGHPQWLDFMRMKVNTLGIGDQDRPETLVCLRRVN